MTGDPRMVLGVDGLAAFAFDNAELEGVRRAVAAGFRSTDTVARLLATIEALRAELVDAAGVIDDLEAQQ